jgi:hypothetical protein
MHVSLTTLEREQSNAQSASDQSICIQQDSERLKNAMLAMHY